MAEEQLVLRVPPALAERLREAMRRGGDMNADFTFSEGGRVGQFRFNETTLQCHLVDLPCVVETHKVYDKGTLLKSSDIGQMIVVHEDGPGAWDGEWKDGLTSASRDIRRRRWRPRQKIDQSLLAQTQKHLLRIMNKQANDGIEYELVEEDISANASARKKKKKKKCPVDAMSLDALVDESNQPPVAPSPALPPEDGMDQVAAAIQGQYELMLPDTASTASGIMAGAGETPAAQASILLKRKKSVKSDLDNAAAALPTHEDLLTGSAASGAESVSTPAAQSKQLVSVEALIASLRLSSEQRAELEAELQNLPEEEQRRRIRAIRKKRKEEKRKRKNERRLKKDLAAAAVSASGAVVTDSSAEQPAAPELAPLDPDMQIQSEVSLEDAVAQGLPTEVQTEHQELGAVYDDGGDLLLENLIDDAFLTEKPAIGEEPASGHDDEQVLMIGIEGHGDAIGEALEGDGADNSNTAQCEMSPRTREMSEDLKRRVSACEEGISSIESKIEQLASHAASAPNPILKSRFLQQKDAQEKLLEKEREKLETLKAEGQL